MLFLWLFSICCPLPSLFLILSWLWSLLPLALPRHWGKCLRSTKSQAMPRCAASWQQSFGFLTRAAPSPHSPSYSCCVVPCFTSPHPYNLKCSSATLPLRADLKVFEVPKSSTHWYQWFRASAMLSKRNILASFINHSKPTVYSFTLCISQPLITKSTFLCLNLYPHSAEAAMNKLCMKQTDHLNCNTLCYIRKQKTWLKNRHLQWNWLQGLIQKEKIRADSQRNMQEKVKLCKSKNR